LNASLEKGEAVTVEQLSEGVAHLKLGVGDNAMKEKLSASLLAGLEQGKLTLKQIHDVMVEKNKFHSSKVLAHFLELYKSKKGEEALLALVNQSGVDITKTLTPLSRDLLCLKKGTDVQDEIAKLVAEGQSGESVVKLIKTRCDEKSDLSSLASVLAKAVFKEVFPDKSSVKIPVLEKYAPAMKLVSTSIPAQIDVLVAAHVAWSSVGCPKGGVIKQVFSKLVDCAVVSPVAVVEWKDDTNSKKAAGKQQALVQLLNWVTEIEQKIAQSHASAYGDDDEDADDDDLNQ
jgi:hypothetical protein